MRTSRKIGIGAAAAITAAALALGGTAAYAHDNGKGPRGEGPRGGALTSLVTDGTVTQSQADAVKEALHSSRDDHRAAARGERHAAREAARAAALAGLVADGTLTQAQADAIATAIESHHESREGRGARHGLRR